MTFLPGNIVRLKSTCRGRDMLVEEPERSDGGVVCSWPAEYRDYRNIACFDATHLERE